MCGVVCVVVWRVCVSVMCVVRMRGVLVPGPVGRGAAAAAAGDSESELERGRLRSFLYTRKLLSFRADCFHQNHYCEDLRGAQHEKKLSYTDTSAGAQLITNSNKLHFCGTSLYVK